jgi:hypothetical protein
MVLLREYFKKLGYVTILRQKAYEVTEIGFDENLEAMMESIKYEGRTTSKMMLSTGFLSILSCAYRMADLE